MVYNSNCKSILSNEILKRRAKDNMKSFLTLKEFLLKHKWSYAFGIIWLLIVDFIQLLVPQILRNLTNDFQNNLLDPAGIIRYALLIIGTGIGISFGRYLWRIYILGTSRNLEYYLRNKIFNHLLKLSPNYFNTHKTGDLMAHATNDINAVRTALGQGIMMIVDSSFMIVLSLIMMVRTTNLRLTAIALFTLPLIIVVVNRFGKIIHKRFGYVQEAFSNLTDTIQESFSGIRVAKSFVQEDLVFEDFTNINNDNLEKNLELVKVSGTFHPFIQFISSISFLLVILYGGKEVILNRIDLGDFIAFNSYLGLLVWPMMALGFVINRLQRGAASMDRINKILEEVPEITDRNNPIELKDVKGRIEFKNVNFKYPNTDTYALKDLNFVLEPGKSLAILGRTGSGKTTIISTLIRLYDINEGSISLDGVDIKNLSLDSLRSNIGYVPQDNFLFSTTISQNIGFSFDEELPISKIHEAAQMAQVYDNVMEFPNKFDTILGERGVTLSGGQKQRTSIARAIAKKPAIMILDDSLSAVDTETEEKILNNLETIMDTTTTIIVSHRISTVKDCDEIIYLDEGRIVERGNHNQLIALNGFYKDLHEKQLLEEKISKE